MSIRQRARRDDGAVAVLYAIVFALVLIPMFVIGTSALVRNTTAGELQRASDAGALAGASAIPFGDVNFARNFIDSTAGGPTDKTLRHLGLGYDQEDPLSIACDDVAKPDATSSAGLGHSYATAPSCDASYLSDPDTLASLHNCADGLGSSTGLDSPVGLPTSTPNLAPLLPALLYPGVKVTMTWHVHGPMDNLLGGTGNDQTFTSIAHRRFKNMVVIPEVTSPSIDAADVNSATINLNPLAGDVRGQLLGALDGTESLLASNPATAACATVLDGAHDDIVDAIDPPADGPDAQQVLDDAIQSQSPLLVARVISAANGLGVPYLDFLPVCADRVDGRYVGHLRQFGDCSVTAPGAFRASLRRS